MHAPHKDFASDHCVFLHIAQSHKTISPNGTRSLSQLSTRCEDFEIIKTLFRIERTTKHCCKKYPPAELLTWYEKTRKFEPRWLAAVKKWTRARQIQDGGYRSSTCSSVVTMVPHIRSWPNFRDRKNNRHSPYLDHKSNISDLKLQQWDVGMNIKQNFKTWDSSPIVKKIHLQFCKRFLEVNNKASKVACRAELVRIPLVIPINQKITKYSVYLNNKDNDSIVKQYFLMTKNLHSINNSGFYSNFTLNL